MSSQNDVDLEPVVTEDDMYHAANKVYHYKATVDTAFTFLLTAASSDDKIMQIVKVVQAQVEDMKMAYLEQFNTRETYYKQLEQNDIHEGCYKEMDEYDKQVSDLEVKVADLEVKVADLESEVADLKRQLRMSIFPTQHVQMQ
jgi:predicted RNase H-like nuclease (RuvC/YqgF family)